MGQLNKSARRLDELTDSVQALGVFRDAARLEIAALKERVADLERVEIERIDNRHNTLMVLVSTMRRALTGSWRERREARRALR